MQTMCLRVPTSRWRKVSFLHDHKDWHWYWPNDSIVYNETFSLEPPMQVSYTCPRKYELTEWLINQLLYCFVARGLSSLPLLAEPRMGHTRRDSSQDYSKLIHELTSQGATPSLALYVTIVPSSHTATLCRWTPRPDRTHTWCQARSCGAQINGVQVGLDYSTRREPESRNRSMAESVLSLE